MTPAGLRFVSSGLSTAEWARFKRDDPRGAVRWAAGVAHSLGAKLDGLARLRGLTETDVFNDASTQRVLDFVEARLSLGSTQAARAATLGWAAEQRPDAPAFTGRVEMQGERVVFICEGQTFALQNSGSQCFVTDASAFNGQIVTVKGWPDGAGNLVAEEFAPGSSPDFVSGRVKVHPDGKVGVQVRDDEKWVEVTDATLARALRQVNGAGVILPGPVDRRGNTFRFDGNPRDYYVLTALDHATAPGHFGAQVAHENGELDLRVPKGARSDLLDARRFVYGHLEPGMAFEAKWVSPPAWAAIWIQPFGIPSPTGETLLSTMPSEQPPIASFEPGPIAPNPRVFADGTLLKEESKDEVYLIVGGAKVHVPNPEQFSAMGLESSAIRMVPDRTMSTVPDVPVDGTLLRELGQEAVFIVVGGAKMHVPNPEQFSAMSLDAGLIRTMPNLRMGQVPDVPAEGTLIREFSSARVYEIRDGKKVAVTPPQGAVVQVAPDGGLNNTPS
jgi:hypothetical protein